MSNSPNLTLPYILAAQSQKHVTHNEAIRSLDALVQLSAKSASATVEPGSPSDGDRYLIASAATGDWAGRDGQVAAYQDGAWAYYQPQIGWRSWVEDEGALKAYNGATWSDVGGGGGTTPNTNTLLNVSAFGSSTRALLLEEELITDTGASVQSTITIPNRGIVLGVSTRTTEAVTGATSYDCGIAGEQNKFGGSLGTALGSTNVGVIGPTAFYADTPIVLTANGGNFTGGKVRASIHVIQCGAATS